MNGWDQQFQDALRGLAESAEQAAAPPLPPAQLRRHTERRHRRRIVLIPSAALAGLLVGGTAYGMAGGFHREGAPPPAPVVTRSATAAPPTAEPAPTGDPVPTAVPSHPVTVGPSPAGSPTRRAPVSGLPTTRPSTAGPGLPLPTALIVCPAAGAHEFLVRAKGLTLKDPLKGLAAAVEAVPVSCVADPSAPDGGRLAPSGPVRTLTLAPGAVLTTTAPISSGRAPVSASPAQLAAGLVRYPDQLFGVRLDSEGRVARLDQVYAP
ncbi:hypothetical protein [Peterkaempfera sp. SMS 1(5)a]|uniref:hypothetical protein n=1 Tax=Peterkaempfera podocarpi TaxID=3232308 RepID=UPI003670120B